MAYPFPFECEPFYMRPFLIVKSITGVFFTILINFVVPIAVALAIIFVIGLVLFAILGIVFGRGPNSEEIKAKREKEKKEREQKDREGEQKERDHKENQYQGKPDAELFTAPLSATASGPGGTYDLEKRLEIELELLGEMAVARRERLAALRMAHSGDEAEYLEVLEKLE
ncbi:hypothetical protein N7537_010212 [Penicillium hordei]|uniref:Uncharacterized protein n=1 Tax=Penicillium hordei TaxID=40994 RepID=A0AAD6GWF5_9EURO|nr:uncharacterized protein N7537_010212 [Penicillium hordei]KAJ5593308.1 hypothetical protein N7537_010212 [Penicillium hordei]